MVEEIAQTLSEDYDIETLSIQIPRVFNYLKTHDAHLEIVTSPTLQPLRLMYNYNKVTKKIAHIFVNTHCINLEYKNAYERGLQAYKLFDEVLEFDQVFKYKIPSSEKIQQVFKSICKEAELFEKEIQDRKHKYSN